MQKAPPEDLYLYPETREVAEFVGEANFIPGTAEKGRVQCVLGDIPALEPVDDGEVEVMLRPESLLLRALARRRSYRDGPGVLRARPANTVSPGLR